MHGMKVVNNQLHKTIKVIISHILAVLVYVKFNLQYCPHSSDDVTHNVDAMPVFKESKLIIPTQL